MTQDVQVNISNKSILNRTTSEVRQKKLKNKSVVTHTVVDVYRNDPSRFSFQMLRNNRDKSNKTERISISYGSPDNIIHTSVTY